MIRPSYLLIGLFVFLLIAACSTAADPNKDTIYQTNRPPDPAPGSTTNPQTRLKKERPIEEPSGSPSAATELPAGENSRFSTKMNEDGSISEIRTFNANPEITRAELTWTEPGNKVLTVEFTGRRSSRSRVPESFDLRKATIKEIITAGTSKSGDSSGDRPRIVN